MTEALKSSSPQPERPAVDDIDRTVHAQLARLTMGLSPASMGAAMLDWLGHLALSPGKQQALARQALASLAEGAGNESPVHDRRFAAPEWQRWPFNRLAQNFQRQERWWQAATTGVHGVSPITNSRPPFWRGSGWTCSRPLTFCGPTRKCWPPR